LSPTTNSVNASLWKIKKSARALSTDHTSRQTRAAESGDRFSWLISWVAAQSARSRSGINRNLAIGDIAAGFEAIRGKADALYVVSDALIAANRKLITTLALSARLPTMLSYGDGPDHWFDLDERA
jgi:hypothetical protein